MFVAFKAHIYILFSEGDSFNVRRNLVTKLLKMYISCLKHRCRFELTLHCLHPTHTPNPLPCPPHHPPTHPATTTTVTDKFSVVCSKLQQIRTFNHLSNEFVSSCYSLKGPLSVIISGTLTLQ